MRCGACSGFSDVVKIVEFVTEYIEHAPALMMVIEEAATRNGVQDDVQPVLSAAEEYFLAPNDIIPDHYGLIGGEPDAIDRFGAPGDPA